MKNFIVGIFAAVVLCGCATPPPSKPSLGNTPLKAVTFANALGANADSTVKYCQQSGANAVFLESAGWDTATPASQIPAKYGKVWQAWKAACDKYGLWFGIVQNSNDAQWQAGGTTADAKARLDSFKSLLGTGIIVEPWSEDARSGVDAGAVRAYAQQLFPNVSQYNRGGALYVEEHPCNTGDGTCGQPANLHTLIVTDCSPMMMATFGAKPRMMLRWEDQLGISAQEAYIRGLPAGVSRSIYGQCPAASTISACYK